MTTETVDIVVKETGAAAAATQIRGVGTAAQTANTQVGQFEQGMNSLKTMFVSLGLSLGIGELVKLTDTYTELINKLKTVSGSQQGLIWLYGELKKSANETGQDLGATIELYQSLRLATEGMGIGYQDIVDTIRVMNSAFDASGRSSEQTKGAMVQLATAMRNNDVSGRAFIGLLRQFPELLDSMARAAGMSSQEFRKFAEDGKLTTKQFVQSVIDAGPEMRKLASVMDDTVGEAFQRLKNNVMDYFGQMDQASGASKRLADAVFWIADNINIVMPAIGVFSAFLATFTVLAGGAAVTLGLFASPLALIASLLIAAGVAVYNFGAAWKLNADGSINAAGALVGVLTQVATWVRNMAMRVYELAGPVGTAVIGIGLLTGALLLLRGVAIISFLVSLISQLGALSTALLALAANPFVLFTGAVIAAGVVVAYFTGVLDPLIAKARSLAKTMIEEVTKSMKTATEETKKTGLAAKDMSDQFNVNGQNMASSLQPPIEKIKELKKECVDCSLKVRNAMGEMVTATSEWAARSGQAFMQVSEGVRGMGNQVSSTAGQVKSEYASMAAVAEASSNSIIQSANKASSASWGDQGSGTSAGNYSMGGGNFETPEMADAARAMLVAQERDKYYGTNTFATAEAKFKALQNVQYVDKLFPIWEKNLSYRSSRSNLSFFKDGGSFEVGGAGGTDSQLVKFMATPGETVHVRTPEDEERRKTRAQGQGASMRPIQVNMTVVTPDAGSFKRNEKQITTSLLGSLHRVQREM
jgi:tape measure domain-containing protein